MSAFEPSGRGPHQGQPVMFLGTPPEQARAAMILMHGRGADARDILTLAKEFERRDFAYAAPNAANGSWYPQSFLAPIEQNEPGLTSGLVVISDVLGHLAGQGISPENVIVAGFSQGACLALEFAARHPRRYGGVVGLSGGLIGPAIAEPGGDGSMEDTEVFLGCSDTDPHIPRERVEETARWFEASGGVVTTRIYPAMGHEVNLDEIEAVRELMGRVLPETEW